MYASDGAAGDLYCVLDSSRSDNARQKQVVCMADEGVLIKWAPAVCDCKNIEHWVHAFWTISTRKFTKGRLCPTFFWADHALDYNLSVGRNIEGNFLAGYQRYWAL